MLSLVSQTCPSAATLFLSATKSRLFSACSIALDFSRPAKAPNPQPLENNPARYAEYREQQRRNWRAWYERNREELNARRRQQYTLQPPCRRVKPDPEPATEDDKSSADFMFRQHKTFFKWIYQNDWARQEFEWRTHTPILYSEKTKHTCATCHMNRAVKLWWKSKAHPDRYDCNRCFVSDWPRALPVGHEGFVFGEGTTPKRPGFT